MIALNWLDIVLAVIFIGGFLYAIYKNQEKKAIAFVGITVAWLILRFFV